MKPLYYSVLQDGTLLFGSELKSLLVHPGLGRDIDPCAVARGEVDLRSQMSPAEVADEILRDLDNDES